MLEKRGRAPPPVRLPSPSAAGQFEPVRADSSFSTRGPPPLKRGFHCVSRHPRSSPSPPQARLRRLCCPQPLRPKLVRLEVPQVHGWILHGSGEGLSGSSRSPHRAACRLKQWIDPAADAHADRQSWR
ncbi:hypothetical protein SETIT_1G148600v2 [Setaria italica]|nr:hypothetical protein SETIT_1G148600v2 [Setaria italica]RCV06255.1 hypothetical protein SETIT_1G148600v2 [Setaria italica]RCV06256.1 hypothetical protein SETIT_1G148600v2 [Setaria italica]